MAKMSRRLLTALKISAKKCENCREYDCDSQLCSKRNETMKREEKCWMFQWKSEEAKELLLKEAICSFSEI